MRKIIFFVLIAIISSCNQEFTSPNQAKNELNDLGLRDGKWVDYIDKNGNITLKVYEYEYYLLSQYQDGKPIKKFLEVNADSTLRRAGTFRSSDKVYNEFNYPKEYVDTLNSYFTPEIKKTLKSRMSIYNENGNLDKNVKYFYLSPNNELDDSVVFIYSYYPDSSKSLKSQTISLASKNFLLEFNYSQNSQGVYENDFALFYKNLQKVFSEKAIPKDEEGSPMAYLISSGYSVLGDSISLLRLEKYKMFNSEINQREQIDNIYKTWKRKKEVEKANIVTCKYCGKLFDRRKGFIVGLTLREADRYSTAMLKIELEKQHYGTSMLEMAYRYSDYYCSERCLAFSGIPILE